MSTPNNLSQPDTMAYTEALTILTEMQLWSRSEPPYDGEIPEEYRTIPYSSEEFDKAIDTAIECLRQCLHFV